MPTKRPSAMQDVDPGLRVAARLLPRGSALRRGLAAPRTVMALFGKIGARRGVDVAAVNPHVTVRVHRPAQSADPAPVLMWMHGGGYVMGSAQQEDAPCRRLAHVNNIAVVAVDYRLAPEYPYPTPLEDCYAALVWLARQPWVDSSRIGIGGASAGGGLAAALALLARDRGEVRPVLQMLVYPMLDDRTGTSPDGRRRLMWNDSDNQRAWQWYLNGVNPESAVPARQTDLSDLPPAWIGVGTLDLFYHEVLTYSRRLREAGTPTHDEVAVGAFHTFDVIAPRAPISQTFFASQCEHLRAALIDKSAT
jgi:acetyl esterase/lipase